MPGHPEIHGDRRPDRLPNKHEPDAGAAARDAPGGVLGGGSAALPAWESVFQLVGRRRVGGGPKATGGDEMRWRDVIRGRVVLAISRVRLRNPQESFLTCAPHRLRDSHVGREGHWIDLRLRARGAPLTPEEVRQIEALAQAGETRPVRASALPGRVQEDASQLGLGL